jgi:hypothetical protein
MVGVRRFSDGAKMSVIYFKIMNIYNYSESSDFHIGEYEDGCLLEGLRRVVSYKLPDVSKSLCVYRIK